MSFIHPARTLAILGLSTACTLAFAHAQLEKAVPGVGATVSASPGEIKLHYSEGVEPKFSKVTLSTEAGAPIATGPLTVDPSDKAMLVVKVPSALKPGAYRVTWRVVSVDTHRTEGSFSFTVAP